MTTYDGSYEKALSILKKLDPDYESLEEWATENGYIWSEQAGQWFLDNGPFSETVEIEDAYIGHKIKQWTEFTEIINWATDKKKTITEALKS